jgi:formiminotetrahydrofolate cyclodeaminase
MPHGVNPPCNERWGDYLRATQDPVDPGRLWFVCLHQTAPGDDGWNTINCLRQPEPLSCQEAMGGRQFDQSLARFLDDLGDEQPAPGGGSAAAVAVAMAAQLARSVAARSRKGWNESGGAIAQANAIARRVTPLIERDARAFDRALRMISERAGIPAGERDAQLGEALGRAAEVPLEIGEAAADACDLAALVAEQGELSVQADALAAALLAEAAARISSALVEVNLGTLLEGPRVERARALAVRATAACERAVAAVGE